MPVNEAVIKTINREEYIVTEQSPIPCFRCGVCCVRYQPPLALGDIENIASALGISSSECSAKYAEKVPTREGCLLKRTEKGCVFLAWNDSGKASCTIYRFRPQVCREWTPSLSRPECLEGLTRFQSKGQIMLLEEFFASKEERERLCLSLEGISDPHCQEKPRD